jgi:5-methylthioadenosine/S-adenosylhomocysteine deaminase
VSAGAGSLAEGLRARGISVAPRARTPIGLLSNLDVLSARPLLIHCVRVDSDDIQRIAAARCAVAHCPASNAKLGHGIAPLCALLNAGITVGIGSDSMASNNRMDLLEESRLAAFLQRVEHGDFRELTAAEVVRLATVGGAKALDVDGEIGSLEVGKAADLAAFPIDGVRPVFDPLNAAVFALPGVRASFVAVAGKVLVRDGALLNEDPTLEERVQASADALQEWLSTT